MKKQINYSVYLVTDDAICTGVPLEAAIEQAIAGGVSLVQLREKDTDTLSFYNKAKRVKSICGKYNIPLIINDRIDIAQAVDADGVHVGQSDMPAADTRRIIGADKILGVSVTTVAEAQKAALDGADYLGVGAMFSTGTKTDAKIVSKSVLNEICVKTHLPIVIIGGINENTVTDFCDTPIDGAAVVSAILGKKDITAASALLKERFFYNRRAVIRNKKAVIFDLDGTLFDSMDVWADIDIKFLSKRSLSVPEDYAANICARSFSEAARYTVEYFGLTQTPESLMKEWHDMAIDAYTHNIRLLPDAREYLNELKKQGVRLAVATSLSKELSEPCLKSNGIFDMFERVFSVNEVKRGKEYPDVFLHTAEKLSLAPHECVVFEDVLPAIKSAKHAGMTVVAVKEKHSERFLTAIKNTADYFIDGYSLAPVIKLANEKQS